PISSAACPLARKRSSALGLSRGVGSGGAPAPPPPKPRRPFAALLRSQKTQGRRFTQLKRGVCFADAGAARASAMCEARKRWAAGWFAAVGQGPHQSEPPRKGPARKPARLAATRAGHLEHRRQRTVQRRADSA